MLQIGDRVKIKTGFGKYSNKIGKIFYESSGAYFIEFPKLNPRYFLASEFVIY